MCMIVVVYDVCMIVVVSVLLDTKYLIVIAFALLAIMRATLI